MGKYIKETNLILFNLLIIVYLGFRGTADGEEYSLLIIIGLISIISFFLEYIFIEKLNGIPLLLGGIFNLYIGISYFNGSVILAALFFLEYFVEAKGKRELAYISDLGLFFLSLKNGTWEEYLLIVTIANMFVILYKEGNSRIDFLENNREELRREIFLIQEKLKDEKINRKQSEIAVRLEERNNLSREMHDKIGHTVSGAILQIEAAKIVLKEDTQGGEKLLDNTLKLLREGVDEIRGILREIKPVQEELGINNLKKLLIEKINNTSFKYKLNYSGYLEEISIEQWTVIINSVRELTTNSLKYSKGSLVKVNIEVLNKIIKIEVSDDGYGANSFKKGIGLTAIEERVNELDGKVIIDGSTGFSVNIILKKVGI